MALKPYCVFRPSTVGNTTVMTRHGRYFISFDAAARLAKSVAGEVWKRVPGGTSLVPVVTAVTKPVHEVDGWPQDWLNW